MPARAWSCGASSGATFVIFRPRLSEYALEMPRKSAIVYPKDVGIILVWADIYPGATVVESGLGSGSLTLALLRAVGPTGQVIVYEQRADMIGPALTNIGKFAATARVRRLSRPGGRGLGRRDGSRARAVDQTASA